MSPLSIRSFNKYLLSTYRVPESGARTQAGKANRLDPCLAEQPGLPVEQGAGHEAQRLTDDHLIRDCDLVEVLEAEC